MARKVFFSFHYDRDVRRVVQVRNSWVVRAKGEAQPFLDKANWEKIKRTGDAAVEKWIDTQLKGTSVTAVLIGAETYGRKWVRYEIEQSYERGNGILGIFIHNVKDPVSGVDRKGDNPLDYWSIKVNGRDVSLAAIYPTYDWVLNDGYSNLSRWIEAAAQKAGR